MKLNETPVGIFGGAKTPDNKSDEKPVGIFGGVKPFGKAEKTEEGNAPVDQKKIE